MTLVTLANGTIYNTANLIASNAPKKRKTSNTVILWSGPSVLDGKPIAAFATFKSNNVKTGDMVQISILRTDINPVEAIKTGDDSAICGNCPHRKFTGGACYVNVGQGPRSIYTAYKRGNIPEATQDDYQRLIGRMVRLGSYGDPAAMPINILKAVTLLAKGWTGYTHQLQHKNFDKEVLNYCMVSADTPKQAEKFHKLGLKTFRVKRPDQPILNGEIECLSDTAKIECKDCGLCKGRGAETNIVINVHGSTKNRFKG